MRVDTVAAGLIYIRRYEHAFVVLRRLLPTGGAFEHHLASKTLALAAGVHLASEFGIHSPAPSGEFVTVADLARRAVGMAVRDLVALGIVQEELPRGHKCALGSTTIHLLGETCLPAGARYTLTDAGRRLAIEVDA